METPAKPAGTVSAPGKPKRRRSIGSRLLNLVLLVAIIAVVALFVRAELERRQTSSRLAQTEQQLEEARQATQRGGEEVAQEVLGKLRRHIDLPTDPAPTVATIVDIERLRSVNEFYRPAENGDHLIITERRAILYDPDRDIIIDVVPVAINPQETPSDSPSGTPDGDAATSPTVTPTTTPGRGTTQPTSSPSPTGAAF